MKNRTFTDAEVYRAYVDARAAHRPLAPVYMRFGIRREHMYEIVGRVRKGNPAKVRRATEKARLDSLWEYKYRPLYEALPKDRRAETVTEMRALIRAMRKDRFPKARIARHLRKYRSTIIHHLAH